MSAPQRCCLVRAATRPGSWGYSMTIVDFYVVKFDMPIGAKYLAIVILSLISSVLLYEIAVRRFDFVRFFMGLKKRV